MIEILLIRHGKTAGNLKGRYIGSRTDEPLCPEGIEALQAKHYPPVDMIYTSPLQRCVQTAEILWPDMTREDGKEAVPASCLSARQGILSKIPGKFFIVPGLMECDFGDFENKNYQELDGNPDYQAWIDSGGTLPFPNGESMEDFKRRCRKAFLRVLQESIRTEMSRQCLDRNEEEWKGPFRFAVVAHGGTIMAILEKYGFPKKQYFDYQVKNGCGYVLTPVEGTELWNCQYLP